MTARFVMLQGTGSDVGKSLLVAGLCRWFVRRGVRVRPFKPQNMSNNAAVTGDGGEIGRAQALQARACRVPPSVHMNPVLLKPQTDKGAQIVIQGKVAGYADARAYQGLKQGFLSAVLESFRKLQSDSDLILIEGAGSPAEVNLRANDIANMGFAEAVQAPVIIVGDIDRGGVIASLVGTHALLSESERTLIKGFLINKFRGDVTLFDDGLQIISKKTGWRNFGVIPYLPQAGLLPAEDVQSLSLRQTVGVKEGRKVHIVVPLLSRIANFDDFDPLAQEAGVVLSMIPAGCPLPGDADLVILPGSKATISDLAFLRAQGWDTDLYAHLRRGGRVMGICGGYQMLGHRISDPDGIEGPPEEAKGLGLLDVETILHGEKTLIEAEGLECRFDQKVQGYEMHMGVTEGPDCFRPVIRLCDGRQDGAISPDGRVSGCYLHGFFSSDRLRSAFLKALGNEEDGGYDYNSTVEKALDSIADHLGDVGRRMEKYVF